MILFMLFFCQAYIFLAAAFLGALRLSPPACTYRKQKEEYAWSWLDKL